MKAKRGAQVASTATLLNLLLLCDVFSTTQYHLVLTSASAAAASEETAFSPAAFTNLVQMTEAVLAPAWGTGGFAYVLDGFPVDQKSSLRPVCFHTRTSPSLVPSPFTFSAFDVQFSPLYLVAADNATAQAVGQLDLQHGCYVALHTNPAACMAAWASQPRQCAFGSDDALRYNWTAASLAAPTASLAADLAKATSLPASGLRAPELFAAFVNDYLPQRAWLRTAVPRTFDALYTAAQTAEVLRSSTAALADNNEMVDMKTAVVSEWNRYLWSVYGPQLRRKWDLLYRYAVATLTRGGGVAPPIITSSDPAHVAESSITGVVGPVNATMCPLVDAWLQLRYNPDDVNVSRLTQLMEAAFDALADTFAGTRRNASSSDNTSPAKPDALLLRLVRSTYCVTTTNLFAITALLDRPFLQAVSSAWIEKADHADSWAWQTMSLASVTEVVSDASAFQSFTRMRVSAMSAVLATAAEQSFLSCLASFLDPTTPLTSAMLVSPSDCVRQFLEMRDASASVTANFTALFELAKLSSVSPDVGVPGMTRYESTVALPSVAGSVASESLQWLMVQESARSLTAQTAVFTPATVSSSITPVDPCTKATQRIAWTDAWDWVYECDAGTYVLERNATCATCPSPCAAATASFAFPPSTPRSAPSLSKAAVPVYCPGDGLLHGCPSRPAGAVYAGSTSGGHSWPFAICRYACASTYMAPLNFSCLSVSGFFYNTSATGNADVNNGGGLSSCAGPASLFPSSAFPVRTQTRLYAFVGSGATNAPLTCPFTLLHRATSSAVSGTALATVGAIPPPPFFRDGMMPAGALASRSGTTWEVEVQLNATEMYALHAALRASSKERQDSNGLSGTIHANADTDTVAAHELIGVHKTATLAVSGSASSAGDAERVMTWYLVSTLHHGEDRSSSENNGTEDPPTASTTVHLQFLLNLTVASLSSSSSSTSAETANMAATAAASLTPAPSSLVVLSSSWLWSPWSNNAAAASLRSTSTYRAVLDRQTNTVSFLVDGQTPLSAAPVTVDWPLWAPAESSVDTDGVTAAAVAPTPAGASDLSFFLSVGGWVAGYTRAQQWVLVPSLPGSPAASDNVVLPLYYDYLPGMVTRVSTVASVVNHLHNTLQAAETMWRGEMAAASQSQSVAQLTSLTDLAAYVAATPRAAANVSAALNALALRTTKGLDGVCRPGYGILATTPSHALCEVCMTGSYTVMSAAAGSNVCACITQRVRGDAVAGAAANQQRDACLARSTGPAVPQDVFAAARTLYVDGDVVEAANATAARIPLGWYAAAASGDAVATTTSLVSSVTCTQDLTYPIAAAGSSTETLLNTSVALLYTTGLGGETCETRAAARAGTVPSSSTSTDGTTTAIMPAGTSRPTYTASHSYGVRLQTPALTPTSISLKNNTALFTDQTVLTVGVRDYALLSFYAVHSLLQMPQLTEYHLSFLAYVLRSATVAATLECRADSTNSQKRSRTHSFSWAGASALDTAVLWLNLTEAVTHDCILTIRVTAAAAAARDSAVPFSSWPYSYLRVPSRTPPSSFFESSAPLTFVVRAPSSAFAAAPPKHNVLGEVSSFVMAICIMLVSLALVPFRAIGDYAPTLDLLPWRRYERELAKTLSAQDEG